MTCNNRNQTFVFLEKTFAAACKKELKLVSELLVAASLLIP